MKIPRRSEMRIVTSGGEAGRRMWRVRTRHSLAPFARAVLTKSAWTNSSVRARE
jgi:hypothetical protein